MITCYNILVLLIILLSPTSSLAGFVPLRRSASFSNLRTQRQETLLVANLIHVDAVADFVNINSALISTTEILAAGQFLSMDQETAEILAGPLFGFPLFPYLAFIYFLNVDENECPKGVTVGFAACLLFVFLTIPAAIAAKVIYGVSLANCDWLHGSAESMLTITNLATVIPFRQAIFAKTSNRSTLPASSTSYTPTLWLVGVLTLFASVTALVPAMLHPAVHTKYLNGFMDLPITFENYGAHTEPDNALTVATWIIHVSSLVEFLVAMGFCWRWGDIVKNPKWKGLTWGLLPLHSSGITACVSHLFYNQIAILVPLQAFLTCVGNTTAAYAAFRIAISSGWKPNWSIFPDSLERSIRNSMLVDTTDASSLVDESQSQSLVGFEDLGEVLANDNDLAFIIKLFGGCALFSYLIKYGETFFDFPFEASIPLSFSLILLPSALNAYKWNRRSQDSSFEGWF